jgi:O-antigen/teichoic acid export membrane protein
MNHLWKLKEYLVWMFAGKSHKQLMISISSLTGSGMIAIALRFIGGIIQGRFVGPEILGYYTKFTILPGYIFFLHLGIFTSVARQYPYYIGKGERATALSYAANALGWTYILCGVHAVVFLVPCLWAAIHGDWPAAMGWGTQIILSVTSLYMFYLGTTYRNSSEFVAWSKSSVISSIASLLSLPLVAIYNFFGVCVRYSLPTVISTFYAHWKRPLKIMPKLDRDTLTKMIVFGAPLMILSYISYQLWDGIERSYILKMIDEKSLGVFAFSGTLCAGLTMVATSISQVFLPRINMLFGSSGKNSTVCFLYCVKCSIIGVIIMLPFVVLTYWLVDPFVKLLLPKYIDCIPITRYLCWLSLIPVIDFPKQLLIVAKRTKDYAVATLTSFVLFLVLLGVFTFSKDKIMLQEIVAASVACKFLSVCISDAIAWRWAWQEKSDVRS